MFKKFRVLFLVIIILAVFAGAASAYEATFKDVSVTIDDGEISRYRILEKTVAQFLKEENIVLEDKDKINVPLDMVIDINTDIVIQRGYYVNVKIDNKARTLKVEPGLKVGHVISSLTEANNIKKDENSTVKTEYVYKNGLPSDDLKKGQTITLVTKRTETAVSYENIGFETVIEENPEVYVGEDSVKAEGTEGKREIVKQKIYESDVLLEDNVVSDTIIAEPVNKVISKGTKSKPIPKPEPVVETVKANNTNNSSNAENQSSDNSDISALISAAKNLKNHSRLLTALAETRSSFKNVSANYVPESYKAVYNMTATAYTNGPSETGKSPGDPYYGITASGVPTKLGIVAVDRNVIPLGSVLYVKGYGYAVAADTGGSIKGNKIDLFFNTYNECIQYGRRSTVVYLVD